jgi:predicted dehydrogenase
MRAASGETFIAIVGCGYVADYYLACLKNYPRLIVAGVFDIDPRRLRVFCGHYKLPSYVSFEALLEDNRVSIVLNLTNPREHYAVSRRCLEAGKSVYSEKPLAMNYKQAEELVKIAENSGLAISSAPCSLLGNAAQTLWHAARKGVAGRIRLVYAEIDDGMIHKMPFKKWRSASGAPWPYKDEFEVGCTLEHAGYYLSWLIAMFGPVESMTASSGCLISEKLTEETLVPEDTPDFSVGILRFRSGIVARLTTGIVGPHNHQIQLIGDRGILTLKDCWFNDAKVRFRRFLTLRRKTFLSPVGFAYRVPGAPRVKYESMGGNRMDFAAGVEELATALHEGRDCRLSADFSLHVSEIALALQQGAGIYIPRSTFKPVAPLDWAL